MKNENQPIVVNMPEGQSTLTILQGEAPAQLDILAPEKLKLNGTIEAPFAFLEKRIGDINQHNAHIIVNRDNLSIRLVFNENDPYTRGEVSGSVDYSQIYKMLGINSDKQWQPEQLSRFLKLNRSFFADYTGEGMKVVSALKKLETKVEQEVKREREENGSVGMAFRQEVVSTNMPTSFKLNLPVFSGGEYVEIEVETFASIDGASVTLSLQSAGANDAVEDCKAHGVQSVIDKIKGIAPEIVIIEQ